MTDFPLNRVVVPDDEMQRRAQRLVDNHVRVAQGTGGKPAEYVAWCALQVDCRCRRKTQRERDVARYAVALIERQHPELQTKVRRR